MATAQPIVITGPSNTRLYAGKFGPAVVSGGAVLDGPQAAGTLATAAALSGGATMGDLAAAGGMGQNPATNLSGGATLDGPQASGGFGGGGFGVGELAHDGPATPEQISLWLPVTGTVAQGVTAACRYRVSPAGAWVTGHPLYRVRPSFSTAPAVGGAVADGYAWPILDVLPGTAYDVEVTLSDGVTTQVKSLTHTTRALPAAAGAPNKTANTLGTIVSQLAVLNPGDVLEIAAGTYATTASLSINRSGNAGSPIYIRGASRTGTILSASAVRSFFALAAGVSDVVIENLTIQGNGVDQNGDVATSYTTVMDQVSDASPVTRITLRNVTATGIDRGVYLYNGQGVLVYDNVFTGNNLWQTSPVNFLDSNRTWNDDGLNLAGSGNCGFNNTLTGFGDTLAYAQHVGNEVTHGGLGIHFYRNDIRNSIDDPVEVDHGRRNLSYYDNRVHNSANCDSIDPLYGGPWVSARNITINPYRVNTHKWNDTNTGHFLYNNTVVATASVGVDADAANWYQPNNGAQRSYGYRNNLHVYRGAGQSIWLESTNHDPIDWTHNAWFPNRAIQWSGGSWANLAAAQAGLGNTTPIFSGTTRRMLSDVITVSNPFTPTVTLGANSNTEVTATYTPALSGGDAAKNSGVVIAGITDGYSGAAPDRGAVIEGRSVPLYGDRSAVPSYIAEMTDFQVRQMTGTWAPANGFATMESVTPSEWITSDPGTIDLPGVVVAWSGGAKGVGTELRVAGGGHNDSANNGMYGFDFSGTVRPQGWRVRGQSTVASVRQADTYSDGAPSANHSYDGMVSVGDEAYRFGGAKWSSSGGWYGLAAKINMATGVWTILPSYPGSANTEPCVIHDPTTNKILVSMTGTASAAFYRIATNDWSAVRNTTREMHEAAFAYDHTRARGIMVGGGSATLYTINWTAETFTDSALSASGSTAILSGAALAAIYDAVLDCYWIFGGRSGSAGYANFYRMNASTFAITQHALSASTAGFQTDYQGSFGRLVLMQSWRAIGFVTRTDVAPFVVKLPAV